MPRGMKVWQKVKKVLCNQRFKNAQSLDLTFLQFSDLENSTKKVINSFSESSENSLQKNGLANFIKFLLIHLWWNVFTTLDWVYPRNTKALEESSTSELSSQTSLKSYLPESRIWLFKCHNSPFERPSNLSYYSLLVLFLFLLGKLAPVSFTKQISLQSFQCLATWSRGPQEI